MSSLNESPPYPIDLSRSVPLNPLSISRHAIDYFDRPGNTAPFHDRISIGMGTSNRFDSFLLVACPGCGRIDRVNYPDLDHADPTSLKIVSCPVPKRSCCGWEGSIINNVFIPATLLTEKPEEKPAEESVAQACSN